MRRRHGLHGDARVVPSVVSSRAVSAGATTSANTTCQTLRTGGCEARDTPTAPVVEVNVPAARDMLAASPCDTSLVPAGSSLCAARLPPPCAVHAHKHNSAYIERRCGVCEVPARVEAAVCTRRPVGGSTKARTVGRAQRSSAEAASAYSTPQSRATLLGF